jgi:Sortilin, neurotensin receptor 3, C-terminal
MLQANISSDFNFYRAPDGSCQKYPNLPAQPAEEICAADPDRQVYYDLTGYRKLAISTCEGGKELEYIGIPHDCPGHEGAAEKLHGSLSGAGLFFAVIIPIAFACVAGYFVWQKWDGKFGRIRLGGEGRFSALGEGRSTQSPWVEYPVAVISGLVAVAVATPLLLASLWRSAKSALGLERGYSAVGGYGRAYTSRSSFARGRPEYGAEEVDEGELLGDEESDEEV